MGWNWVKWQMEMGWWKLGMNFMDSWNMLERVSSKAIERHFHHWVSFQHFSGKSVLDGLGFLWSNRVLVHYLSLHVEDKTESKATEFKLNAFRFKLVVLCRHSPQEECVASGAKFKCLGLQSHPNRPPGDLGRFSVPRSPAWSKSTKESARTSTMCPGNWDPVGFYRYERFRPNCSLTVEG